MTEPHRIELTITPGEALPVTELYAEREAERTRAYLESVHGPIAVDTSEEGLAKNADAATEMEGKKLSSPLESQSEQVRDKAQKALDEPAVRTVLDGVVKTLTGVSLDEAWNATLNDTLRDKVSLKVTDPIGNTIETLARKRATESGMTPEMIEKVASVGGLVAGVLFPTPGGVGKAGKLLKEGKAVAKVGTNVERVGAITDVKVVMRNLNAFQAERLAAGRKVVTHDATIAASRGALSLEEALRLADDVVLPAEKMTALRDHYNAASTYLADLAKRTAAGDQTAAAELPTMFMLAGELAAKDEAIGRNVARGLESRKILSQAERAPLDLNQISELASRLQGASPDMDPQVLAARLLALPKPDRIRLPGQVVSYLKAGQDAIYEAWINALLSGPQTHAANVVSNSLTTLWAVPERALAATLDLGALTGARSVYHGETGAMLYGLIEGAKDGIRIAGRTLREGVSPFGADKIERAPAIAASRWGLEPDSVAGGLVDMFGALVRTPGRLLMTEDSFFKAVNYRMELRAAAYREAASEGLSGKPFADRVRSILADPPASIKTRAEQFALTQTFNRELGDLGAVGGVARGATGIAEALPLGRVVLPFVRTPANILHYASERTPVLNLMSDTLRADLAAGGARRAEALGKIGAGGMVSAAVATYAATSINADEPVPYMTVVTGEGPRDSKMRATLQRLGWQPYSIWNGSEYVSYRRTDPLGTVLGIVATSTEMLGQLPEAGAAEVATATAISVSKAMLSKTFMEGLSSFLDSMEGNAGDIKRFAQSLARSGVPAGVRQTTRALIDDPIRRDMDSLYDHWRSGLPGYDGPPEVNLWGDPIMLGAGLGPDLVSPIYTSEVKRDDVDEYLARNRIGFGRTPRVVAGTPPPGVRLEPETAKEGVKLTKEERHRLGVLVGKGGTAEDLGAGLGPMAGMPPLKDELRAIIAGPGTDGPDGSKADFIKNAVNRRKRAAIEQLRRESPELDTVLKDKERARIDKKVNEQPADPVSGLIQSLGR